MPSDPKKPNCKLQVSPDGADFRELINGSDRTFKAGAVFIHPNPTDKASGRTRVEQLLEIHPCPVLLTDLPTEKEKASQADEDAVAETLAMEELRAKARKIVADRKAKMDALEAKLRKLPADALAAEVKKQGIKDAGPTVDEQIKALLDKALAELKAAA